MSIFELIQSADHEQVVFCSDKETGLKAIIAIHNSTLGPALGGTRMWPYKSDEEAIRDVLRLSKGMTYKAAVSGLNLGGGKAVIIGDARTQKNEMLMRAYGRFVQTLNGRYITAEDVGTSVQDMGYIRMETSAVTGVPGGSGDPSPFTAYGVYYGMKACAKTRYGTDSLVGKKVAIQGAGNVASHVADYLTKEGARVVVTDIYEEKAKKICDDTGAEFVAPDAIYDIDCDIFCPTALGGILNDDTIARLKCAIVAGGANNQLLEEAKHARMLADRDILFAPDYVINAGGLMNVAAELDNYDKARVLQRVEGIYDIMHAIIVESAQKGILTVEASNAIAERRLSGAHHLAKVYVPNRVHKP